MKRTLLAAAVAAIAPAWAQTNPQQVVITGNPLGRGDAAAPASVLTGEELLLRRGASLGETLDGLPGVSSTRFGPNASRPVIRGQDGDRIRVLSNAGASVDVSSLSFDHAVPIDPLAVERLEVLRGPAALLYGGSAVGGVVNAIDNRIPKAPTGPFAGAVETRLGGAAGERAVSAMLEGGGKNLALHADAFKRNTSNLRVPGFERLLEGGGTEKRTSVANSASDSEGGAVGASWLLSSGFVGASIDSYRSNYGIVAEDDIKVRMRRDKVAVAGEVRAIGDALGGFIDTLRVQAASTDYQHQEVQGDGSVGTTFKSRGSDARLEANHRALTLGAGRLQGTWGLQWDSVRFSALGEEAFVPSTYTRQAGAFVLEQWSWGEAGARASSATHSGPAVDGGHISFGLRAERVRVQSAGDAAPDTAQFGPPQARRFSPFSAALAGTINLGPHWRLTSSLAITQRAPTNYELYANGVHAATGAFEQGNAAQRLERGRNADLVLAWQRGPNHVKASVFDSRFSNYILLAASGADHVDVEGNATPTFTFKGVRARLYGGEAEAAWQLASGPIDAQLDARLDWVRGRNLDAAEPLPRLAPLRATVGLTLSQGTWSARIEAQHAARQTEVPSTDEPTAAYTLVNLSARYRLPLGPRDALLFVKLHNAGNQLAYNATSTSGVRALSPLAGRALSAGLRFTF